MTVSYNWLSEYLPISVSPEKLSEILTSIGLEVESMTRYESVRGALEGLITGEVMSCVKHPEADKLKLTTVNIGQDKLLNIVCGAPNVAAGQKVIVATVGTTIYPTSGEPLKLKKAKIRGAESEGMICAEDEIGLGNSHDGIKILPPETETGIPLATLFKPYTDFIYEIGLTPNRMDAMSHIGVAKDVCAYLSYHEKPETTAVLPYTEDNNSRQGAAGIKVTIENTKACKRYCGILITGCKVEESPEWLQQKLKSIGLKPINNIVDCTNFILHESGQPLHAFDADRITGGEIIVKNVPDGTVFKTLDEKERKLSAEDLLICNPAEPMCIAGVYGGINSGVTDSTVNIFLESAFFDSGSIRKTSLRHSLRTDAATRFEKGVDIGNTLQVLKRAASLIIELSGGNLSGDWIDRYPEPAVKNNVALSYAYLRKLSGKDYSARDVKNILTSLGFSIIEDQADEILLEVPFSKPDITLPADIVEEIMRIDGLDNIEIPSVISISPALEKDNRKSALKEKTANYLVGLGFSEIFTNSITNSAFYDDELLRSSVKMINSLSADLDMLRPEMLQSGLQVIAHNINRKNNHLRLFEFGKTYAVSEEKNYLEKNHLSLYISGDWAEKSWKSSAQKADYFHLKGVVEKILTLAGISTVSFEPVSGKPFTTGAVIRTGKTAIGKVGEVSTILMKQFDIKQPVFYAELDWEQILSRKIKPVQFREIPKFPVVNRDLALVVDKNVSYFEIEQIALSGKMNQLTAVQLFDVFESEKLGPGKKSMALSFTFLDESKTLTDKEIDGFMQQIISGFEKNIQAEIRK